ncbi:MULTISPECIES: DUF6274 family protein [unclassified Streptomyces]|uniref:DUF6274 family protein n=1 Tax=unclassified Streptomyces TaxID=2593676 RepID=UPI000526906F|nr:MULTISPECIES: DUF6274 family protein [unclassified Streptomyces]
MPAAASPHATRALLRAHLSAAAGYRHLTRRCPICHRLLRLALEPATSVAEAGAQAVPAGAAEGSEDPAPAAVRPPRRLQHPLNPGH